VLKVSSEVIDMSLFRQIWLAVIASTLIAFAGSFVASMLTARHYLEQQLAIKNNDNAASLALSMSQLDKDPVTVELQVAAVFDSGQYAVVRLIDPNGKTLIEKASPPDAGDVPKWFVRLFPIVSQPGQAQVTGGWKQLAPLNLSATAILPTRNCGMAPSSCLAGLPSAAASWDCWACNCCAASDVRWTQWSGKRKRSANGASSALPNRARQN
jgi:hypothetical protein